jgi:hypothetical protein
MNKLFLIMLVFILAPTLVYANADWVGGAEMNTVLTTSTADIISTAWGTTNHCLGTTTQAYTGTYSYSVDLRTATPDWCTMDAPSLSAANNATNHQYFSYRFRIGAMAAEDVDIVNLFGTADAEGELILKANRTLYWVQDDTSTTATGGAGTTVLNTNQWYTLQIDYLANSTVTVSIDGVADITATHDGDGIIGFTFGACMIGLVCGADNFTSGAVYYFDDLIVRDSAGTTLNSLPSITTKLAFLTVTGAGDSAPPAGACTSVDEMPPNDNTDFATLSTDLGGDTISCNLTDSAAAGIGSSDAVTAVYLSLREAALSAASEAWRCQVQSASAGTINFGPTTTHNDTSYATNGDVNTTGVGNNRLGCVATSTDPTTGIAWTPTGTNSIDNMLIGVNSTDGNPDIKVTALWAYVEYVPFTAPATTARPDDGFISFE